MEGWVRLTPATGCYIVQNPLINSETSWDLGPGTLCCSARTWTNISLSSKMQRNYKGLKVTTYMQSWGKLWTTRYERPKKKPNCYFWRIQSKSTVMGAKAGYCTWPVNTTLPKQWVDHLNHPSGLTPTLIPWKAPARPHLGEWASKGSCYLLSFPSAASGAPVKPCLSLSGLLSISVD